MQAPESPHLAKLKIRSNGTGEGKAGQSRIGIRKIIQILKHMTANTELYGVRSMTSGVLLRGEKGEKKRESRF